MDILSHTFSGLAVGTVAIGFVNGWKNKASVLFLGALGGFLPDIDAISYWKKFDATIGSFLHLKQSGYKIYHSKIWYGHHGALHSITFHLLLSVAVALAAWFLSRKSSFIVFIKKRLVFVLTFVLGALMHLLEDLPTPDFVWRGVRFFWPSPEYIGGFGKIWWWNNYDIVLIIITVVFLNLSMAVIALKSSFSKPMKWLRLSFFLLGFSLIVYQMNTRNYDFNYEGFAEHHSVWQKHEAKSKAIQRELLGDWLYQKMNYLDRQLPVWF